MSCHEWRPMTKSLFQTRMDIEIVHAKSNKPLVSLVDQLETATIGEIKKTIASKKSKYRDVR